MSQLELTKLEKNNYFLRLRCSTSAPSVKWEEIKTQKGETYLIAIHSAVCIVKKKNNFFVITEVS